MPKLYHTEEQRRERYRQKKANWLAKHPQYEREYRLKRKLAIFELLGSVCRKCGFDDHRALQIDHVAGGGHTERETYGTNLWKYYKRIKANPERYQLLCANCNWIKRHENDENRKAGFKRRYPILHPKQAICTDTDMASSSGLRREHSSTIKRAFHAN